MTARILFLITQDLQSPSGLGRYLPFAAGLIRSGYEVHIAALHPNFEELEQHHLEVEGVSVDYVAPMHVKKQGSTKIYYSPLKLILTTARAALCLTHLAIGSHADFIHICKPHPMNGIAGLFGKWAHRSQQLYVDCDDYEAFSNRFSGGWQRRLVEIFENGLPRRADLVTYNTYFTLDRLRALGIAEDRLVYLPNGVDRARFASPEWVKVEELRTRLNLSGKRVVVYVGSLSLPSHPVDLLLSAFAVLHERFPDTHLLIVGGGEDLPNLQDQTKVLTLGNSVCFTGRVPAKDVPLYYLLGDVSVDPVYDTPAAAGRSPLKMFESWAAGIPFVTQDVGDRRRLAGVPPAALLAHPGSPESLADALEQVIRFPSLAAELRARGLRQVQDYYWDRIVERTAWIYQSAA